MYGGQELCSKCVLPAAFPGISFDEQGICSVCRSHEERWEGWVVKLPDRHKILAQLCSDAKNKKKPFDVLVPLSGGKDSMYVLYLAVKEFGLKPLVYTLDNGYLTPHARQNIDRACRILGVEHVYYCLDPAMVNALFALFMRKTGYFCSVCLRGISMASELIADLYDIPLVFGGSSARTELPLTREMFQPGPVPYMRNVLQGEPIACECERLMYRGSLKRRVGYRWFWWGAQKRIRICAWINLPDYVGWDYDTIYRVIRDELKWQAPAHAVEHTDCGIHPVTTYLHNRRFPGLEVRRLTLARLIQAGQIEREEALRQLREEPEEECPEDVMTMFLENLGMTREEFDRCIDAGPRHMNFVPGPNKAWEFARKLKRSVYSMLGIRR